MSIETLEIQFSQATSIKDLNYCLKKFLNDLNINTFSFTYYDNLPSANNRIKFDFYSKNYAVWHKHYVESGYENIDSSFTNFHSNTLPLYWNVEEQIKHAKCPRERKMRKDTFAFGAREGLTIPIFGMRGEIATLLAICMQQDKKKWDWQRLKHDLFLAGHLYYNALQLFLSDNKNKKSTLTKRELQCLNLIAKQVDMPTAAKILGISIRTVNFHLHNINKKLGVKNKHQAVFKAYKMELIDT